jgi:dihydroxyacetone kinase-like protein
VLRERVETGAGLADALAAAREAGEEGMRATVPLQARKGRASYLGERSIGHQDPGATSTALILAALERSATAEA